MILNGCLKGWRPFVTDRPDVIVVQEPLIETVTIADEVQVLESVIAETVEIGVRGSKGDKGDQGDQGPQGPQGVPGSGDFSYVHDQMIPSATWTIVHGLNGYPNITVVDSSGREVVGEVTYVDANTISVQFASSFGGKAYLS